MAHTVAVDITSHPLSREENGVTFTVMEGEAKYGELVVSKGGLRWRPRNNRDHHFMSWKDLDTVMREYRRR
ncbi:MAG: hypothetical protein EHM67_09260 [Hyphomicrobiaceae bacterium]|nr:MAG: hypothetical protein EHM67_09260 [Hyphomicrobiaceae bacterium]